MMASNSPPLDELNVGNSTAGQSEGVDPVTYCTIIGVIVTVGVIGNCLNIVIYSSRYNVKDSLSVYFRVVAVSDSLVLISTFVDDTVSRIDGFEILYGNKTVCPLVLFTNWFWPLLSSSLLVAIAVDRYIAVAYPLKRASWCTYRRAIYTAVGIVCLCVCLSLPEIIWSEVESNKPMQDGHKYKCPGIRSHVHDLMVTVYSFLFILFIPFSMVMTLNLRAYRQLSNNRNVRTKQGKGPTSLEVKSLPVIGVTICSVLLLLPILLVEVAEFVIRWVDASPQLQGGISTAWDTFNVIRLLHYTVTFYFFMMFSRGHRKVLCETVTCRSGNIPYETVSEQQEIVLDEVPSYRTDA